MCPEAIHLVHPGVSLPVVLTSEGRLAEGPCRVLYTPGRYRCICACHVLDLGGEWWSEDRDQKLFEIA